MQTEQRDAIRARRALLREQTGLLGARLPWLADPALIPPEAVDASVAADDVRLAAFSLAGWMLIECVQAAQHVNGALHWQQAMDGFHVAPGLQASVARSVLCPAAKHAPGLFAIAEIMAVVPLLASRCGLPRERWHGIARRGEAFGALLARDGTAVQVLLRNYLYRPASGVPATGLRSLNPACLRLDEATGLSTVTPLGELLAAARTAAARHYDAPAAICVALQAPAPQLPGDAGAATMFGAIWGAFAAAADRLVFPRFDPRGVSIPAQAAPDPAHAQTLECIASQRQEALAQAAAQPYPPAVERILGNLLAAARPSASRGPSQPGSTG